jgi:hypothetical protein
MILVKYSEYRVRYDGLLLRGVHLRFDVGEIFSRFIAVAAVIGPVNCDARGLYYPYEYPPGDEAYYPGPNVGCQCTKAAIAFAAFSWYDILPCDCSPYRALWLISFFLVFRTVYIEGRNARRSPVVGEAGAKGVELTTN